MYNQNAILPETVRSTMMDTEVPSRRRRRKRVQKNSSPRRGGISEFERQRRRSQAMKLVVFTVYGLLMFQTMLMMQMEFLYQSLAYNAAAFVWLYLLKMYRNTQGKQNFKVATNWLVCQAGILILQALLILLVG